jgi:hypothetical protein
MNMDEYGSFAYLIRRRNRRLVVFLLFTAMFMFAVWASTWWGHL